MKLLQELAKRFMSPAEDLFWNSEKRIEASVGLPVPEDAFQVMSWQIRPAETMYGGPVGEAIKIVDAASLHLQTMAQANFGLRLPDIRFRVITTGPDDDGYAGTHFGTLAGAKKLGQKGFDKSRGIIDGSAKSVVLPELPSPE